MLLVRIAGLIGLIITAPVHSFELVSAQDMAQESAYLLRAPAERRTRSLTIPPLNHAAPQIELLLPKNLNGVHPPFPVELRFTARPGMQIDPLSLKVRYGLMGIDLTDRIRKGATVTPEGLKADRVEIPNGDHRLFVRIADSGGQIGEKEIRIKVGD